MWRQAGIIKCVKQKLLVWSSDLRHNARTKSNEIPSKQSVVIQFLLSNITCEAIGLGMFKLRYVRLVMRMSTESSAMDHYSPPIVRAVTTFVLPSVVV